MHFFVSFYLFAASIVLLTSSLHGQDTITENLWENVFENNINEGFIEIPTGPFTADKANFKIVSGQIRTVVYQTDMESSTFELLNSSWEELEQIGFNRVFQCDTQKCGGFQFRHNIEVVEPPNMFVNLGDFKFITATRVHSLGKDYATILVSRSLKTGFIQIIIISQPTFIKNAPVIITNDGTTLIDDPGIESALFNQGFAILYDIEFKTGEATLENDGLDIFFEVASFLEENPNHSIVLVGHTDTSGSAEVNSELSFERAKSVQQVLINQYGVNPKQLSAYGNSFFSPRSTNLTPEGQRQNRRVEAILIPNSIEQ